MLSSIFNHNWNLLKSVDLSLANQLAHLSFESTENPANAQNAYQEALEWFQHLPLEGIEVLYVFGLGSGHYYLAAQAWLKQHSHRRLIFLEDHLTVIYQLLQTALGTLILEDLQVDVKDISNFEHDYRVIHDIVAENTLRPYLLTALTSYQQRHYYFDRLNDQMAFETTEQNAQDKEMAHFGMTFFTNFYRNLLELPHAYDGQALKDQFKNVPAIICGAGPSLLQHIPFLQQLKQQALIFAPGSSINILNAHGIEPHFGVNIDPFPETFNRQIMNRAFETPFFYLQRIYHEALPMIHGPRLFLAGGTYYKTTKWFEQELNLPSSFLKGGYNVVSSTLEIAYHLGCNPIVFVGMDLSFIPGQHYASGLERHPLFPPQSSQAHMGEPLTIKDRLGRSVQTYWIWVIEAHWIDTFYRDHPDRTILNATEGGLGLFSVPYRSIQDIFSSNSLITQLDERIHTGIQQAGFLPITTNQVVHALKVFEESLKKCYQLCEDLYQNESGQAKLTSLFQEPAFIYCLSQFYEFYLKFTSRDRRLVNRLPDEQRRGREQQLNRELYAFLIQTLLLQLKLIEIALKEAKPSDQKSKENPLPSASSLEEKRFYYASGHLYSYQTYHNGLKHGTQLYYYPQGHLKTEMNYKEGLLHGLVHLYYPSGQLKRKLTFDQGQRHGIERSWHANGQLFTEIEYDHNEPLQARAWSADGQLIKEMKKASKNDE